MFATVAGRQMSCVNCVWSSLVGGNICWGVWLNLHSKVQRRELVSFTPVGPNTILVWKGAQRIERSQCNALSLHLFLYFFYSISTSLSSFSVPQLSISLSLSLSVHLPSLSVLWLDMVGCTAEWESGTVESYVRAQEAVVLHIRLVHLSSVDCLIQ